MLALQTWQNFYILTGTASATLIGLLFVAASISIGVDFTTEQINLSIRTFVTPTLIYYIQALFISCLALLPFKEPFVIGGTLIVLGSLSITLAWKFFWRILTLHHGNKMQIDDWLWNFLLPLIAGILCVCTALGFLWNVSQAPTGLCITDLLCLTTGLRNTWALTTWLIIHRKEDSIESAETHSQEAGKPITPGMERY